MGKKHAILSASGSKRWMTCAPSALMERTESETASSYADEGTLAHDIATLITRHKAYRIGIERQLNKLKEHELYNPEMIDYGNEFAEYTLDIYRAAPRDARLLLDYWINLSDFIPDGFGTLDVSIVGDDLLKIVDYKYGKGVPVDAYENSQMMIYALGAYMEYHLLYNIKAVSMTIYQPRIDNISTYEISAENLLRWGYEILKPSAIRAYQGIGDFVAGDHCKFCRIRATCRAHAAMNLELAKRDFEVVKVTDEQVSKILLRAKMIKNWVTAVEQHALKMAIAEGKIWPGLKLVEGRSVRKFNKPDEIAAALLEAGYNWDEIYDTKLKGITALKSKIKKEDFKNIVEANLDKPPGKPTLVSIEDTRPEFDRNQSAKIDFDDDFEEEE